MEKYENGFQGLRNAVLCMLFFPVVIADLYGDCLRSTYSKKFICKSNFDATLSFNGTALKTTYIPVCPKKSFIFVGDSLMIELKDVFQCICPNNEVKMLGAKGTKMPASKVLREHGKMFNKDSVVVLNFGLWFNSDKRNPYITEIRKVKHELHALMGLASFPKVVFMTTTAQHFCTKDGAYRGREKGKCCNIPNLNTFKQDYAMKSLIEPLNISYFDAFYVTKKWFRAHPGKGDCTHLCSNENGPLIQFGLEFLSYIQLLS